MRIKIGIALALLALGLGAGAQTTTAPRPVMALNNFTTGTETFCAFDPNPVQVNTGNVTTAGASVTVTAVGAGTPFVSVGVGDQLIIGGSAAASGSVRTVATRASSVSITVDSAINLAPPPAAGYPIQYRKLRCSTDGTTGFFSVSGYSRVNVDFNVAAQVSATGVDVRLQCRVGDINAPWKQVFPLLVPPAVAASYTTLASGAGGWVYEGIRNYSSCRLGIKCTSTCTSTQISATAQMEVQQ
jgi:hypothetical protein